LFYVYQLLTGTKVPPRTNEGRYLFSQNIKYGVNTLVMTIQHREINITTVNCVTVYPNKHLFT